MKTALASILLAASITTSALADPSPVITPKNYHKDDLAAPEWRRLKDRGPMTYERCMAVGQARGVGTAMRSRWCTQHGFNR